MVDRGIHFLIPVHLYPPVHHPDSSTRRLPHLLLAQRELGAVFDNVVESWVRDIHGVDAEYDTFVTCRPASASDPTPHRHRRPHAHRQLRSLGASS
jgi:hypothetical protein